MCGRFEQSETPRYYADALSAHISKHLKTLSDNTPSYNVAPGQRPWMIMLHNGELLFIGMNWGYRTPNEAAEKKKPWICARVEKSQTGNYFRHMFREGRVIISAGGWYEWSVENGKKQPWYITRKVNEPIFRKSILMPIIRSFLGDDDGEIFDHWTAAKAASNTCYFALPGIEGDTLVVRLDKAGFAVASGAACSRVNPGRSHVLEAMAVDPMLSRCAVRLSLDDSLRAL